MKFLNKIGALVLAGTMLLSAVPVNASAKAPSAEDPLKIGLLSDTHYFSQSLYSDCDDFTEALHSDRKLLQESDAILTASLKELVADEPDLVLISGDITKDGERVNHQAVADKLTEAREELADRGVDTKFYVVPGNHDINNAHGLDFSSGHGVDAERTDVEAFREIYRDFGYNEDSVQYAPESDRGGSLSYVVRPAEGYTLIAVDSNKYSSDQTASGLDIQETGGVIGEDLLNWVSQQAQTAKDRGDLVMVMQHHGVNPHFSMEPAAMADYLVDNWQEVQQVYADSGVSMVFTGHMHANDIASYTSPNGNVLYDIETGSLLTYPCRYRVAEIQPDATQTKVHVETRMPSPVNYTDFDTGELHVIDNITEYAEGHLLSNVVIETMITHGLLDPMFGDLQENGGIRSALAGLLEVSDPAQVDAALTDLITGMLPTDKENGLRLSAAGFDFSIYYDSDAQQVRISQVTGDTAAAAEAMNVVTLTLTDGTEYTMYLNEEQTAELYAQLEESQQTCGLFDAIELLVRRESLTGFVGTFLDNIDQELIAQPDRIYNVVNTLLEQILNAPLDESHTVVDLVNYSYKTHLAGDEVCEPWAEAILARAEEEPVLSDILTEAVRNTQDTLKETLACLPIDLGSIVEKGNNSITTGVAAGLVSGLLHNAGDLVDMVDLSSLIPAEVFQQISDFACDVSYSMTHDNNCPQDNEADLLIDRILPEPEISVKFDDVNEDSYFYDAVLWAGETEITDGVSSTMFAPYQKSTRAQMVTFLWNAEGRPEPEGETSAFVDVPEDAWYSQAVRWAAETGLTEGVGNGQFLPNRTCTRAEAVTLLWKYLGQPEAEGEVPFADVQESSWFYAPVQWAVENGITLGVGGSRFGADEDCIRAQTVTFLYRALSR